MITAAGLEVKRMDTIISELEDALRSRFGENIDTGGNGPLGQIIGIFAEREALLWELAQDIYNSQYPDSATGASLDKAVALTGTSRKSSTFSTAEGIAKGARDATVPAGTIVAVDGNNSLRFVTQSPVTIDRPDGDGWKSEPVELVADRSGPIEAAAGTITSIITPVNGLESFTNEAAAVPGRARETDAELKIRRRLELGVAGSSTVAAIRAALVRIPATTSVRIFENISPLADPEGRPPHSIEALVLGGDDETVAEELFTNTAAGITFFGDVLVRVNDDQGFSHPVRFSRPDIVQVHVDFRIERTPEYPPGGDDAIRAATVALAGNIGIGEPVVIIGTNGLVGALEDVPGISGATITLGRAGDNPLPQNLPMGIRELAVVQEGNITVN